MGRRVGDKLGSFQAGMVAMGATVGMGNVVGVGVAISTGGPGAIFWLWIAGLFLMAVKFAEATLSVHFRRTFEDGSISGGSPFYLARGLGMPWLGTLIAVLAALAAFGAGNVAQVSVLAPVLEQGLGWPIGIVALATMVLAIVILAGGVRRVAGFMVWAVPLMTLAFMVLALVVIFGRVEAIPAAFARIVQGAFNFQAAAGGAAGGAIVAAFHAGVSRGVFATEAGLGSSGFAYAQADVDHPVRQGFWGVFEVFVSTFIIMTLSALVFLTAGNFDPEAETLTLLAQAFALGQFGVPIMSILVALFSFHTLVSWGFYGEEAARYLVGDVIRWPYRMAYAAIAFVAAPGLLGAVLPASDFLVGLMLIPHMLALAFLSWRVLPDLVRSFFRGEVWRPPTG
jgi:AGCS family alanine or glycine:cation symporter